MPRGMEKLPAFNRKMIESFAHAPETRAR